MKEKIKELEVISRYLELIPLWLQNIRKQLWNIPERRESFTSRSAEVILPKPTINIMGYELRSQSWIFDKFIPVLSIEIENSMLFKLCMYMKEY